jgi:hypothetical protein
MSEKKLFPDDEGSLMAMCFIKDDQIVLDFGKSIKWLSVGTEEAKAIIATLQKNVDLLEAKQKKEA